MSQIKTIRDRSILSRVIKGLAIATGVIVFLGGTAIIVNWTFIQRLLTYPENPITNVDWYQPREVVKGNPIELPEAESKIDRPSLEKISAYAESTDSSALLVMHQGKLVLEKYWQGFKPASTFNSMSMSKTITALLIGMAIDEGKIESELDPVANYIPEWQDNRSQITIQDLLYMQSGLRNWDDAENPASDLVQMYASTDADAIALKIPAEQSPGQAF